MKMLKSLQDNIVEKGQQMLDKSLKTELTALPKVKVFYLITNRGIYTGQDKMENFSNQSSIWLGLFLIGNEVINELRSIKEK